MAQPNPASARHGVFVAILAALAFASCTPVRAQEAGAGGLGGVTDYPIPPSARQAYSPIGEGFESPLDPRKVCEARHPMLMIAGRGWKGSANICTSMAHSSATPDSG